MSGQPAVPDGTWHDTGLATRTDVGGGQLGPAAEPTEVSILSSHRHLVWTLRLLAVSLALVQAWVFRYEANPDGVSYLDVADAYREGRWSDVPNGYWSPLYPGLLAVVTAVLRLPPSGDFVAAHAANVIAFVLALATFEYFLRGIDGFSVASSRTQRALRRDRWILGYVLFVWATVGLIGLGVITPDILTAGAAFTVAGILVRLRSTGVRWRHAVGLGVAAGLGYLTKAAFFPLAIVFLVVAGILWSRTKRAVALVIVATLSFAIVGFPYALQLSREKGRPTFGEAGRLAYAWMVNGVAGQTHWQGGPSSAGVPIHPTRQISVTPDAYEFATPLRGTYPPWYDPSYWYDGVQVKPDLTAQIKIAYRHLPLILELHAPLLFMLVGAVVALRLGREAMRAGWTRAWRLIVPSMAAIAMYALVFLERRYVAPFAVMAWFGVLLILEPTVPSNWRRGLYAGAASVLLLSTVLTLTPRAGALLPGRTNVHWDAAVFVHRSGVRPGDRVAIIGDGVYAYWARLADVALVAELPARAAPAYWEGDSERQRAVLEAFRLSGATAVVAENPPRAMQSMGWRVSEDGKRGILSLATPTP